MSEMGDVFDRVFGRCVEEFGSIAKDKEIYDGLVAVYKCGSKSYPRDSSKMLGVRQYLWDLGYDIPFNLSGYGNKKRKDR